MAAQSNEADFNAAKQFLDVLTVLRPPVQTCSTSWKLLGILSGPTSIAFLFYRLSQTWPDKLFKGQSLLDWAEAYLALGERYTSTPRPKNSQTYHGTINCGTMNEYYSQLALRSLIYDDDSLARALADESSAVNADDHSSEICTNWSIGRIGYIYLLRFVAFHKFRAPESDKGELVRKLLDAITKTEEAIKKKVPDYTKRTMLSDLSEHYDRVVLNHLDWEVFGFRERVTDQMLCCGPSDEDISSLYFQFESSCLRLVQEASGM
ncbi:uncharacterized protein AB675_3736 [Cyphellophora attinorum]|uniref:Uncharacterized protein n=1 Tax=Cyphellophora attinorum TaxID=1664694 RepID=A0A0N0NI32_9EURO|nr:uncharacterized protein AB675_3736 [Phialophora attinorum]KPI35258.1 hypothetical protein AB675_3736 [Phialophora attinorum]